VVSKIEAVADQAFRVVSHLHTGKLKRPHHLVAGEQTQLDALANNARGCAPRRALLGGEPRLDDQLTARSGLPVKITPAAG
jgi:hypothetical protein